MKKIIFILLIIVSIIFVSCNVPTEVNIGNFPVGKAGFGATFTDFFDPVELVHIDRDGVSAAIIMDKNTGVLYVWKRSGYQFGISPIYDSDGSVLTKDKWLAKQSGRED